MTFNSRILFGDYSFGEKWHLLKYLEEKWETSWKRGLKGKKGSGIHCMHSAIISSLVAKSSSNDEMATGIDRQNKYAKRNSV